jgi:hypothetical protein
VKTQLYFRVFLPVSMAHFHIRIWKNTQIMAR